MAAALVAMMCTRRYQQVGGDTTARRFNRVFFDKQV